MYTLAAFLHSSIWQAHNDHRRQSLAGVYFNLNNNPLQADDCAGIDACKHVVSLDDIG